MRSIAIAVPLLLGRACSVGAQTPRATAPPPDQQPTFQIRTQLVLVPVVARDRSGRAIGNLTREDFKLFDNGQPQEITRFSVEGRARNVPERPGPAGASPDQTAAVPERFFAYLFDDLHLRQDDLPRIRDAAFRHLDAMTTADRAAIYTVSGRVTLDFTADRETLRRALDRLQGKPAPGARDCLELNDHLAGLVDKGDRQALAAAVQLVKSCERLDNEIGLPLLVRTAARQRVFESQTQTRVAIAMLRNVIRRTGAAPGQRTVVLISEGFAIPADRSDLGSVLEAAAHDGVVVNTLNSRGLIAYAPLNCPASASCAGRPAVAATNFEREADAVHDDTLAAIAEGTGGRRFHNNNDYTAAFRLLAAAPEFHYVLGFAPQDLKLDGKFHAVKVTLARVKGIALTARAGYYATAAVANPEEAARQEIHTALYSRADIGGIPFDLRSRVYQSPDGKDTLEVAAWLDPKDLRMRAAGGVNTKSLTVVFGLFDADGKILMTTRKDIGLRIRDLDLKMNSGRWVAVKTTFPLKAGARTVRVVLRDADEQLVSAASGPVGTPTSETQSAAPGPK